MSGDRKPKTAGSRRWQAQLKRRGTPSWWYDGVPKGQERVAFNFVCRDHPKRTLGFFFLETFEGATTTLNDLGYSPLRNGFAPLSEAPDGHKQVRLICDEPGCRIDVVYTAERVHGGLHAIWQPHVRRVVTMPVPR